MRLRRSGARERAGRPAPLAVRNRTPHFIGGTEPFLSACSGGGEREGEQRLKRIVPPSRSRIDSDLRVGVGRRAGGQREGSSYWLSVLPCAQHCRTVRRFSPPPVAPTMVRQWSGGVSDPPFSGGCRKPAATPGSLTPPCRRSRLLSDSRASESRRSRRDYGRSSSAESSETRRRFPVTSCWANPCWRRLDSWPGALRKRAGMGERLAAVPRCKLRSEYWRRCRGFVDVGR